MITSREKLEDMKWLEELYDIARKLAIANDPRIMEVDAEIEMVKESLKRGDWKMRQAKADAHCKARGCTNVHVCWRYGL